MFHFLRNINCLGFVGLLLFVGIFYAVAISYVLHFIGFSSNSAAPVQEALFAKGWLRVFVMAVLVGPLFETALHQLLIRRVMQRAGFESRMGYVLISAIAFGLAHSLGLQFWGAFIFGLLLAMGFVARDFPGGHPYLLVACVHSLRNAVSFVVFLFAA
ncbi:CPBP family glutamic-type intramembrane protease [Variovorax boronicumulans]|uniref:CPBP family glutamic-type intramembrane protease n=1 Tax=Variovorax boronicumulans TaxID=436515 RepID=UPI001C55C2DE